MMYVCFYGREKGFDCIMFTVKRHTLQKKGFSKRFQLLRREWLCVLLQLDRNLSDNFLRQRMTSRFLRAAPSNTQHTALGDVSKCFRCHRLPLKCLVWTIATHASWNTARKFFHSRITSHTHLPSEPVSSSNDDVWVHPAGVSHGKQVAGSSHADSTEFSKAGRESMSLHALQVC